MSVPFRVLFVCTGNICRSPTAEALLRHHAGTLPVVSDSCGTSAEEFGNPPHPMTVAELERRGVVPPARRARQLTAADFYKNDWLVPMTSSHERALHHHRPEDAQAEIRPMLSFAGGGDVPDPWYAGTRQAYRETFDLIEGGILAMLVELRAKLG